MAAYAALVSLMHIIENLELHPCPPMFLHKEQLHRLTQEVSFLQEFLEGYDPHVSYSAEADLLESRIAEAAHAAEDVIESYIVDKILSRSSDHESSIHLNQETGYGDPPPIRKHEKKIPSWKPSGINVYEFVENVIKAMASVGKECMEVQQTVQLHTKSTPPDSSISSSSSSKKSTMVGADNLLLEMKSRLTADACDLKTLPIVGMGGSGKTTLALNIYQDRLVKEHFDICAWATISQEYSIREILIQVLSPLIKEVGQDLSDGELGEMLHKHLFGRKYLIIMDDIWNIDACDVVKRFLPDNKNGSRIMITTRLSNLAAQLNTSSSLEMKLLNEVDSWDLLSRTVFGKKGCPSELAETGINIALSCKGLPLSIVVVGGLLAKSKHNKKFWKHVEGNLNLVVNSEDDERCLKILHMSYKQLPVHLKPCFLYMGVFREDKEIYIPRVVKLWVAEGFLKPTSGKSLEEVARVYIKDLADRNLILIDKIGRSGNIKQCRIHDLLRDLSLREAEKQRFYTLVVSPQGIVNNNTAHGQCRHIVLPIARTPPWNAFRHIFDNPLAHTVLPSTTPEDEVRDPLWSFMNPLARSLTCHNSGESLELPQQSMSLLRVLDSRMVTPRYEVHRLVNSRFLDLSSNIRYPFPSSIWQFWNLQTLISLMYEDGCYCATISSGVWYMPHIRHLHFPRGVNLPDPPLGGQDDIILGNLQTLEIVHTFKCSEEVVRRIPNIEKLKISYTRGVNDDRDCLRNLDRLHKLRSLYCTFMQGMNPSGVDSLTSLINFPPSLQKLTLNMYKKVSSCGEDILDKIGALPLLENLRLYEWSFNGEKWETTEGQFCSLKFLVLDHCEGLKDWATDSSHFPCLEQLRLSYLDDLKEIPLDFVEISTLRQIYMERCSDSVVVSAKRILEEQEEFYGEEAALQVRVKFFYGDKELLLFANPNFHFIWDP